MIPTVTKYEFPTPLQLEDICKNEKLVFSGKKKFLVNRVILIFKPLPDSYQKLSQIFHQFTPILEPPDTW